MIKKLNFNQSNNFFDYALIFFCITPFWILSDLEKYRYHSLFVIFVLSIFLFFSLQLIKKLNKNFSFFLIASIFFLWNR